MPISTPEITDARDLPPCDLVHVSEHAFGWEHYGTTFQPVDAALIELTHVVPCGDTRLHTLCHSCWCEPSVDLDDPFTCIHNSHDGREKFERGEALMS